MFNYWFTILTYSRNRDFSSGAVSDTVSFFRFVCDVLVDRLVTAGQTAGVSSRRYEGHRPAAVQGSRWGQKNASNVPDCIRFATWNIGTMSGRSAEVVETLHRRKIDVCCVKET